MKNSRLEGKISASRKALGIAVDCLLVAVVAVQLVGTSGAATGDGRIAFASDRSGTWQIYTMKPDGSDQVQVSNLAPTNDDLILPSISPNGREILFTYNSGQGPDLYVIHADGSGVRQLTNDHVSFWGRWSPDAKRIVFSTVSKLGVAVIATMAADGSRRKILTTDIWESVGGFYSPNGREIIFGSQIGGLITAAWIMNADGSNQRRLTQAALRAQPWSVSPDGKRIAAYSNQNSPAALENSILLMNLDGSGMRRLAHISQFHHDVYPSFSPDGSRISFISDRFSSDVSKSAFGTFDVLTVQTDGSHVMDIAPNVGSCPNDSNCVTPYWGSSPERQ
jgi:Tol biopolymer transport system component